MCEGDVQLHLRYQQNAKHITRLSRIHTSRDRIACDHKQLAFVQNLFRGRALLSLSLCAQGHASENVRTFADSLMTGQK